LVLTVVERSPIDAANSRSPESGCPVFDESESSDGVDCVVSAVEAPLALPPPELAERSEPPEPDPPPSVVTVIVKILSSVRPAESVEEYFVERLIAARRGDPSLVTSTLPVVV
jgi:hypothetical protein